jgi:heme-degrading monooxygenase HmoA
MIAMIFEFSVDLDTPGVQEEYQQASAELRELLSELEGFHGIERFESSNQPGRYVAIAYFDSEEAVSAWRNRPEHRKMQALGRSRFFTNYRLVMAEVLRDYGPHDRAQAPADSRAVHG